MIELINYLIDNATELLQTGGPLMGFILIFLESIIPALPLGAFITLNINAFGFIIGFIISWTATCLGCYIAYLIFASFLSDHFYKFISKKNAKKIKMSMDKIKNMPLGNLVVLVALPFTPAFLVNIAAGLAKVSKKKFLTAIIIGKISITYFWGFIGTSFLESMSDIKTIILIATMLIIAFLISKYISKKTNIE